MFAAVERFVAQHRACGEQSCDVGALSGSGYAVEIASACGARFASWVTAQVAERDLLCSRLLAFPN